MRQQGQQSGKKEDSNTKKIIEAKASKKDKKEAILADARKKQGINEEKRQDFKKRTAEAKAKRDQKPKAEKPVKTTTASTSATTASTSATTGDPNLGRLKRRDMDPNRSVMAQRVEHQMKKTGMTREDAKSAILARREVRQGQIADVQSQYGVGAGQARNIVQYANRNKVAGTEGQPAVANFDAAKRIVQMARNKGLTRKEAAGVIEMRKQARQTAASPAQTPTV